MCGFRLVKTAPGDADYPVVLKYGGQLPRLSALARVEFPLMRTREHPRRTEPGGVVRNFESYDWFDFGGTMRLVEGEGIWRPDLLKYNTRQIGLAIESLHSEDSYARTRAANNLKSLQAEAAQLKQSAGSYEFNDELTQQLDSNTKIQRGLDVELNQPADAKGDARPARDNRSRLGDFYRSQAGSRASEVVNQSGANFEAETVTKTETMPAEAQGQQLNPQWLAKNRLDSAHARGRRRGRGGGRNTGVGDEPGREETNISAGDSGAGSASGLPGLGRTNRTAAAGPTRGPCAGRAAQAILRHGRPTADAGIGRQESPESGAAHMPSDWRNSNRRSPTRTSRDNQLTARSMRASPWEQLTGKLARQTLWFFSGSAGTPGRLPINMPCGATGLARHCYRRLPWP